MATYSYTPSQTYVKVNPNDGPVYIECYEPGKIRIVVANTGTPPTGSGTYHKIKYPGGAFSYGGGEAIYVRNDADTGSIKVIATEII